MSCLASHRVLHAGSAMTGDAEADLVRGLRRRDAAAYEMLVRELGPRMLAVAARLLPCPQDAADALQEAFISAFQSIDSFGGEARLGTWMHRITVNCCLMSRRSRRSRPAVAIDFLPPPFDAAGRPARRTVGPDETFSRVERGERQARVRECINSLPEPHRSVLLLRDIEELDTEETARLLGTTVGAVKTRLHRARRMLRSLLERLSL